MAAMCDPYFDFFDPVMGQCYPCKRFCDRGDDARSQCIRVCPEYAKKTQNLTDSELATLSSTSSTTTTTTTIMVPTTDRELSTLPSTTPSTVPTSPSAFTHSSPAPTVSETSSLSDFLPSPPEVLTEDQWQAWVPYFILGIILILLVVILIIILIKKRKTVVNVFLSFTQGNHKTTGGESSVVVAMEDVSQQKELAVMIQPAAPDTKKTESSILVA